MGDEEDFWEFIDKYETMFVEYLQTNFRKADRDGSGELNSGEMSTLLREFGFSPTPWTVAEYIVEITGKENALLGLEQFMKLNQRLLHRAGFTRSEEMELKALFNRYDRTHDGQIDVEELKAALAWCGFANQSEDEVSQELVDQIDKDCSGAFDFSEFLIFMRYHKEQEMDALKHAFGEADDDHSGTINAEELPKVFDDLGYVAAHPQVIQDGIKECGLVPKFTGEYVFEDVYILLDWFRSHEGFSDAEMAELSASFKKYDREENGQIGGMDLGNAIRWLGYPQTVEQLNDCLEEFDLGDGGFHTMAWNMHELKDLFKQLCGDKDAVTLWDLQQLMDTYKLEARDRFRNNSGFTDNQVQKFQREFKKYDPQRDGFIDGKDLRRMLAVLFPNARSDAKSHNKVQEILKQVEGGGGQGGDDQMLDFEEYLKLMRVLQDDSELLEYTREKEAIEASNFSRKEVSDFRTIFQMFDSDNSGSMSFSEFVGMLGQIFPDNLIRGAKMTEELQALLDETHKPEEDEERRIDFPGFLIVMRKMQDQNFGGLQERLSSEEK